MRITNIEFSHDSSMVAVAGWDGCWHLYRKVSVNVVIGIKCVHTNKRMFEEKETKAKTTSKYSEVVKKNPSSNVEHT